MSELRSYFTKENVTPDGLLHLLGGYDWVEVCLNPDEIYVNKEYEIDIYQGLKIILTRGEYRYKYVIEVIYLGDYFDVGRYRLQMTKHHRYVSLSNRDDNHDRFVLGSPLPDRKMDECAWVAFSETVEEFITNFQLITNTTLFL
jgi:hypothetical protein